ncbi:peptidase S8/S53 domain-containing protein [Massariosphaeria phaeospora]|uniref:Peptidase S8/S53 domain-containing protein n=1 Tax=Massariosphaeria phaeospora TaxID=100035 RepID=A0A7C8I2X0_9PLEO|nr:peptidase S8/S53 domain-containing protein [Massariosphaeria phaeospora]
MKTTLAFAALLASWSTVIAAPHKNEGFIGLQSKNPGHNATEGKTYIAIAYKNETSMIPDILRKVGLSENDTSIVKVLHNTVFDTLIIQAGEHCHQAFIDMPEVAVVEEEAVVQSFVQRSGSPWGLQRISNEAGASGSAQGQEFTYTYENEKLGAGVDIYVIDSGVRTSHAVFTGRAQQGFTFSGAGGDGDGHGTHVAGTAAGAKFGVASGANIIAIKVLGDDGAGLSSDTVAGMNWVIKSHEKRKTQPGFVGSVMSMSWGLEGKSAVVDEVIMNAVNMGIHVSVAAGNDGKDACGATPSHNGGASSKVVTVGSTNIDNQISSFSNVGKCVDIYAPGEEIVSAWNLGDDVINFLSGTSMACPHVSGVMAYLMAEDPAGLGQNPEALKKKLLSTARKNAFTGNTGGSANLLLSNGANGGVAARLMKKWIARSEGAEEKRTVTGGPAAWAKDFVNDLDKRWNVHSTDSPLRL